MVFNNNMFAEIINRPLSGEYDEKSFDLETVWKSSIWCWVKFITNDGNEWVGSFRGKSLNTAIAEKMNQVAVLTNDCIYILNVDTKELLFHEAQTECRDIIGVPNGDKFLVASYYFIGILDGTFNFQYIDTEYDIDNIRFIEYNGDKLIIELTTMYDYNKIVKAYIDTNSWTLVLN